MIQIEKNVPLPPARSTEFPFDKMDVGDSFLIPNKRAGGLGSLVKKARNLTNFDFVGRTILEGEKLIGVRIWRIK